MDDWGEIRALFERCLELDPDQRRPLLFAARPEVRIEVGDLLAAHEGGRGLFREGDGGRQLAELASLKHKVGEVVGGCLLVEELGQGGTGTVYRAEQPQPRRSVAIKILSSAFIGPRNRERFQLEIELLSRLRHEGIAQIYSAGFTDLRTGLGEVQVPYYVREFVHDSRTLELWRGEQHRSEREILEVVRQVARAMQHAHERGIVHQDLKPQNVLVGFDGRVKIIDFGSGRLLGESDSQLLASPHRMGTPSYMAPEQFSAESRAADTRIDVHAIGLILFEMFAGSRVFEGDEADARSMEALVCAPSRPSLRERAPGVSRELDAIVSRAIHADPEQRYGGAGALARDLEQYLARGLVDAYGGGLRYQARVWARTNRVAATVTASLLVVAIGLAAAAYGSASRALTAERAVVEASRQQTESAVRSIDLAIHVISRLPTEMGWARSDPQEQQAYWLRVSAENLKLVEDYVPDSASISLALARAHTVLASQRQRLEGVESAKDVATDSLDRAASYLERFVASSASRAEDYLSDCLEFEIGLQSDSSFSGMISLAVAKIALGEGLDLPADSRTSLTMRLSLMTGDRSIKRGDVDGGLAIYREALRSSKKRLPLYKEDKSLPVMLVALHRRTAAIECFRGQQDEARALLEDGLLLAADVPSRLETADLDFETQMSRLMLGALLSRRGQVVEGGRLIEAAKVALEGSEPSLSSRVEHTKALVQLRVAQFLLGQARSSESAVDARTHLEEALAIGTALRWKSSAGLNGDPTLERLMIDREARRIVRSASALLE